MRGTCAAVRVASTALGGIALCACLRSPAETSLLTRIYVVQADGGGWLAQHAADVLADYARRSKPSNTSR